MKIQSIVVPTDFSECARAALARAVSLARLDGASIHLVHALRLPLLASPYDVAVPASVWQGMGDGARERVEALAKDLEADGISSVTAEVAEGDPVKAIGAAVEAHHADLVVMGTHGYSGLKHAFLGSVAERVLRTLACPVLAVRDEGKAADEIRCILVPVDFSKHSDAAAEFAAGLAARLGASLHLLHAVEFPPEYVAYLPPEALDEMEATAVERLDALARSTSGEGVNVEIHHRRGVVSDVIVGYAKQLDADLVVMGTRGHTGLARLFLGSATDRTLRNAPCSVLSVKASE